MLVGVLLENPLIYIVQVMRVRHELNKIAAGITLNNTKFSTVTSILSRLI